MNAPVAQINYDYYEDLTPESFTKILDDLAAGKAVKPGPQVDAPVLRAQRRPDHAHRSRPLCARERRASRVTRRLSDGDAKKPGEPANVREAALPKPPIGDSSANRQS